MLFSGFYLNFSTLPSYFHTEPLLTRPPAFHPSIHPPPPLPTASDSHLVSGEGGESGGDSSGGGGISLRGSALGCKMRSSECLTRRWRGEGFGGRGLAVGGCRRVYSL